MNSWDTNYLERKVAQLQPANQELVRRFILQKRGSGVKDNSLRHYATWLGHLERRHPKRFTDVTGEEISTFLQELRDEPTRTFSDTSLFLAGALLRSFYRWLLRDEIRPLSFWDAFRIVRRPRKQNRLPVTDEETQQLIIHCRTVRDILIIELLREAGLRRAELTSLKIGSIHFDDAGAWISLPPGNPLLKTGARRVYVIKCARLLRDYLLAHPLRDDRDAPLLLTWNSRIRAKPLSENAISLMLRNLIERAQLRNITAHLFRHTRATELARNDWGDSMLRLFFGWSTWSKMPSQYTHLAPEFLRDRLLRDHQKPKENPEPVRAFAKAFADALVQATKELDRGHHDAAASLPIASDGLAFQTDVSPTRLVF